jgi:ActR/RegA family two-component response regulator
VARLDEASLLTSIKTLEWKRIHQTLIGTDFNISEAARRGHAPAHAGTTAREAISEASTLLS